VSDCDGSDVGIIADGFERRHVVGRPRPRQAAFTRVLAQRGMERIDRREIEFSVAPLQNLDAVERVRFQPLDEFRIERFGTAGDAKGAVVHVAAGASGNLADLAGRQVAMVLAVELAQRRKCHVIDIEIEAHADRIGGDQEFDIARLIKRDLSVAGARRQGTQHHGGAAALTADQLGNRVNVLRRKGDDGGAGGKPRDLLFARVGELR